MAGGILWFTHLYMKRVNIYKYPIGKLRVQPVGIIVFAAVMATLGISCFINQFESALILSFTYLNHDWGVGKPSNSIAYVTHIPAKNEGPFLNFNKLKDGHPQLMVIIPMFL